mgnify:CR=1 FL=1
MHNDWEGNGEGNGDKAITVGAHDIKKRKIMLDFKLKFLECDGKKSFVVLTHEKYPAIEEALQDASDLQCLKEARAEEWDAPTPPLDSVRKTLSI